MPCSLHCVVSYSIYMNPYSCLLWISIYFYLRKIWSSVDLTTLLLVKCRTGSGSISACGGSGFAGGGGGRISVDIFSRHDEPVISAYGMLCNHICLYKH